MRRIPIVMISIQARKLVKVSIIMIATRSIKIENVIVEQNTVAATMFGANTLQSVNTSDSGVPFAQYETAITVAGVTNLRFSGGTGKVLNNLLVGSTADALSDMMGIIWVDRSSSRIKLLITSASELDFATRSWFRLPISWLMHSIKPFKCTNNGPAACSA